MVAGMGNPATGAWSNQVIPPVDKDQGLGTAPDFAADTSAGGAFGGVQMLVYPVEHVP